MGEFSLLMLLALIPPISLLIFIYFKDKKEKEPFWLLFILFLFGVISIIPAAIWEFIGQLIISFFADDGDAIFHILMCFFVIGPAEEICKYFMLRVWTWKNKNFDYLFDGIVYSVFVSLGFAAFENIMYVFSGGIGTAIARMLTAIPGHTCFAVYMGYFYSKAKYYSVEGKKSKSFVYKLLAIFVPATIHAIYDCLVMVSQVAYDGIAALLIIAWAVFVLAAFVVTFIFVIKMSKNDYCIAMLEDKSQVIYRASVLDAWNCKCGNSNRGNFCPRCGSKRPVVESWFCTSCGAKSYWNFCGRCGLPKATIPHTTEV